MAITPLQSLVATGTKLWLDSIDPVEVEVHPGGREASCAGQGIDEALAVQALVNVLVQGLLAPPSATSHTNNTRKA